MFPVKKIFNSRRDLTQCNSRRDVSGEKNLVDQGKEKPSEKVKRIKEL